MFKKTSLAILLVVSMVFLAGCMEKNPTPVEVNRNAVKKPEKTNDNDLIKKALAEQYKKSAKELNLIVNNKTASHARGTFSFIPQSERKVFLAKKAGNFWQIIFDGNGSYFCKDVTDFPETMIPDCAMEVAPPVDEEDVDDLINELLPPGLEDENTESQPEDEENEPIEGDEEENEIVEDKTSETEKTEEPAADTKENEEDQEATENNTTTE